MSQDRENKFRVHRGRLVPDEPSSDRNRAGWMRRAVEGQGAPPTEQPNINGDVFPTRPVDGRVATPRRCRQRGIFERLGLRRDRNRSPVIGSIPRAPRTDSLATDRLPDPGQVHPGESVIDARTQTHHIGDGRSHTSLTFRSSNVPHTERIRGIGDAARGAQVGDEVISDGTLIGHVRGIQADQLEIEYFNDGVVGDDDVPVEINNDGSVSRVSQVNMPPDTVRWNPNSGNWEAFSRSGNWLALVRAFSPGPDANIEEPVPELIHDPVNGIRLNDVTGDLEARDRAGVWTTVHAVDPAATSRGPSSSHRIEEGENLEDTFGRIGRAESDGARLANLHNDDGPGVLAGSFPTTSDPQLLADVSWCVGVAQAALSEYTNGLGVGRSDRARSVLNMLTERNSLPPNNLAQASWALGLLESELKFYADSERGMVASGGVGGGAIQALRRIAEKLTPIYVLSRGVDPIHLSQDMRAEIMALRTGDDSPRVLREREQLARDAEEMRQVFGEQDSGPPN